MIRTPVKVERKCWLCACNPDGRAMQNRRNFSAVSVQRRCEDQLDLPVASAWTCPGAQRPELSTSVLLFLRRRFVGSGFIRSRLLRSRRFRFLCGGFLHRDEIELVVR